MSGCQLCSRLPTVTKHFVVALGYGLSLDRKVLRPFKSEAAEWFEHTVPSAGFLR